MKKILIALVLILAVVAGGSFAFLKLKVKSYNQEISLKNQSEKAEVIFDDFGIPHIYANNNADAFRMLGYVQASDRLFQMEILRRVGGGNLSEILGEELIETDKYIRTVGLNENAKRAAQAFEKNASPELKENVAAFLEGVNQYVEEGETPIEFTIIGIEKTPFTLTDIHRALGYLAFGFTMELKTEPLMNWINVNLGPEYLDEITPTFNEHNTAIPVTSRKDSATDNTAIALLTQDALEQLPLPIFYGSNSWVIGGSKTKSGKVLFANDTHIGFTQPSIWYEAHIKTPDLNLYGNFLAGIPYPIIGHNLHHSWGLTIFPADQMDLYNETIKDNKVLYKNEWQDIETREEQILVKGQDPVNFFVNITPHGPIISDLDTLKNNVSNPVSLFWVANNTTDKKLNALEAFATTNSLTALEKGVAQIDVPGLNVMYGDVEGNIGWFGAAVLIKRPENVNPTVFLDGASGNDEPLGFYDFSENPKSVNPESGFVYSANNQPDSVNGFLYPGYYYSGARARVIYRTVKSKNNWDIESMKKLVMSNQSPVYPQNVKEIAKYINIKSEEERTALNILMVWDGRHQLDDIGPTIYYKLIYHILHKAMADEMGEDRFDLFMHTPLYLHTVTPFLLNNNSPWWDDITTPEKETRADILNAAFTQSYNELNTQLGGNIAEWKWERVHFIEHPHPLGKVEQLKKYFNVGPFPAAGGEEVLNKIAFWLNPEGVYVAKSGPAMRILLDFTDIENSLSINPTGQSGYFMNPHYQDQALMYVNGEFRKQKMNREDILENKAGVWVFVVEE